MTQPYPAVVIDGAVPRSDYERCVTVFDYLICLPGYVVTDKTEGIDPGHAVSIGADPEDELNWWSELEDEIIEEINVQLPDEYVCTLGEAQPGDVIVREIGHPSEEMS